MSEIATGKLVIWMRLQAKRITPDGNSTSIMLSAAADRLEKQETEISELKRDRDVWDKAWADKCDRLAAYEDTCFTPAEVAVIMPAEFAALRAANADQADKLRQAGERIRELEIAT